MYSAHKIDYNKIDELVEKVGFVGATRIYPPLHLEHPNGFVPLWSKKVKVKEPTGENIF